MGQGVKRVGVLSWINVSTGKTAPWLQLRHLTSPLVFAVVSSSVPLVLSLIILDPGRLPPSTTLPPQVPRR